jgi:hypothetical protein
MDFPEEHSGGCGDDDKAICGDGDSSGFDLSSDEEDDEYHPMNNIEETDTSFHVTTNLASATLDSFMAAARAEPFYTAARELRNTIQGDDKHRLETPSAAEALVGAQKTRTRFTTELVEAVGTQDQRQLWIQLGLNLQDEYICRVFLPIALGGVYGDD